MAFGSKNRRVDIEKVKQHWEDEETVSLKDRNLQLLERRAIINELAILRPKTILDVGCGDCSDTVDYCDFSEKVFACDYSLAMLKKAKNIAGDNLNIYKLDLMYDEIEPPVDVVITKRCLINMGNFKNQVEAIKKIHKGIKGTGYYLMLECSLDGLNALNLMRRSFGLPVMTEPFHNVYFNLNDLHEILSGLFTIERRVNFSTYYFLTRVYNQLVAQEDYFKFDALAKRVHESLGLFGQSLIGPQFLLVLKKS